MKTITFFLFCCLITPINLFSQSLQGIWQGILYTSNYENPKVIYLQLNSKGEIITGTSKEEWYISDFYTLKNIKGTVNQSTLSLSETNVNEKKINAKIQLCNYNYELTYNESTGYLSGTYNSSTCRNSVGKAVFYQSNLTSIQSTQVLATHSWVDQLIKDLKKNRKAPKKQEEDRKNFAFHSLYFDYDKAEIRPEYSDYLTKMAEIVDGHSDLRIQVTGHTDGDGSDAYNIDLSKRRAKNIQDFFRNLGLEDFKVIIDFKGEKMPVDSNSTPEGKQKNRRVDFQFI